MANEKMEKCITLMLTTDLSQKEIADQIKVSENTITNWKKTDKFKETRDRLNKEIFGDLAIEATKTMRGLLKAKSEMVRYTAAKDLLDRAGFAPVERKDIKNTIQTDKLDGILEQLRDSDA